MESRKITIVSNKNSNKVVINTSAKTLADLKVELTKAGIPYNSESAFYEGISKTELLGDESVLPTNIPYKDPKTKVTTVTNNLVIMVTVKDKKIKSGTMSRSDLYAKAKQLNLGDAIKAKFGKNYTQVSSADLEAFILSNSASKKEVLKKDVVEAPKTAAKTCVEKPDVKTPVTTVPKDSACQCNGNASIKAAISELLNILVNDGTIEDEDLETVEAIMQSDIKSSSVVTTEVSDVEYSNSEIDSMFKNIVK